MKLSYLELVLADGKEVLWIQILRRDLAETKRTEKLFTAKKCFMSHNEWTMWIKIPHEPTSTQKVPISPHTTSSMSLSPQRHIGPSLHAMKA